MAGGKSCRTVQVWKDTGGEYDVLQVNAEGSQLEHYLAQGYRIGKLPESESGEDEEEEPDDVELPDELEEDEELDDADLEEAPEPLESKVTKKKPAKKKPTRR